MTATQLRARVLRLAAPLLVLLLPQLLLSAAAASTGSGNSITPPQHQQQQQAPAAGSAGKAGAAAQHLHAAAPPVWPEVFTATLFQNRTNKLAMVTLVYDWKREANLNLIASQLGSAGTIWDLEWNNGTSFIFSRDTPVCKTLHFDVGILTPDWLAGSRYLGETVTDNFVTSVWTKADFINYYADKDSGRPVRWTFLWSDAEFHTMAWEEGTSLSKEMWQAPPYCFTQGPDAPGGAGSGGGDSAGVLDNPLASGRMMRLQAAKPAAATPATRAAGAQQARPEPKVATS